MKKKIALNTKSAASLSLLTILLSNQLAIAATTTTASTPIDFKVLQEAAQAAGVKVNVTSLQVNSLIQSIESLKKVSSENETPVIKGLRGLVIILGLVAGGHAVKNGVAETTGSLSLAAISSVVSTLIEGYIQYQTVDLKQINETIVRFKDELSKSAGLDPETTATIIETLQNLSAIQADLASSAVEIKDMVDKGNYVAAATAVVAILIKQTGRIIPQKTQIALETKFLGFFNGTKKAAEKGQKGGVLTLAGTNPTALLSTVLGVSGPNSQKALEQILTNLQIAQIKLNAAK